MTAGAISDAIDIDKRHVRQYLALLEKGGRVITDRSRRPARYRSTFTSFSMGSDRFVRSDGQA